MHESIAFAQPTQFEVKNATNTPPLKLTYNFNYTEFKSFDLQELAKATLGNFIGFMRVTFDGLLTNGKALQNFYLECVATCPDGKKVFEKWLATDFGASRWAAESAMKLSVWFEKLPSRLQYLVRERVQHWKISALILLTRVTEDVLEEIITTGKKTAAQVKKFIAKKAKKVSSDKVSSSSKSVSQATVVDSNSESKEAPVQLPEITSTQQEAPTPKLGLGVRIIVQNESTGWNGACGVITDIGNNDDFWVLLDHAIAQGRPAKNLLKSHQLRLERTSARILTTDDIEQIKAEAIKQYKLENAEIEQARFAEIQGAAEAKAKESNASFEKHARNMEAKVTKLVEHLRASEQEIARLQSLNVENQRLQQRVTELENALIGATKDTWGNTFNAQAAKVLNSNIEKTVPQLLSKIERLEKDLQEKDAVIVQLQQTAPDDSIISEFGEIGAIRGWNGWGRSGYRDTHGTLHKGMNAISAFVSDLTREFQQEIAF
ncbi:hypothetical protein DSM106972_097230 [Dulcicalothrix desertica PCC 7102]|uniref:Uncharacterized protein n=1 Tax=Dulcicalothrix desertica PCC 7102 TaxID=232991 RepID=A0A3S1A3M2_9CYAN|nr:hypothetical protein [Dulcicalothrix desertica]RUS93129.1 hypothetical protein DSM106972_097230 [Dulcicalothrix desertica PCC 7102]TWH62782.1 hypothetical protein CAL7102_00309 [Dulcicalothrix desertica PCC 7102]